MLLISALRIAAISVVVVLVQPASSTAAGLGSLNFPGTSAALGRGGLSYAALGSSSWNSTTQMLGGLEAVDQAASLGSFGSEEGEDVVLAAVAPTRIPLEGYHYPQIHLPEVVAAPAVEYAFVPESTINLSTTIMKWYQQAFPRVTFWIQWTMEMETRAVLHATLRQIADLQQHSRHMVGALLTGLVGPARTEDEPSCEDVLDPKKKTKPADAGGLVWFGDNTTPLRVNDPKLSNRIAVASGVVHVTRRDDFDFVRTLAKRAANRDLLVAWGVSGQFKADHLHKSPRMIQVLSAVPTQADAFARVYDTTRPVQPSLLTRYAERVKKLTAYADPCIPCTGTDLQSVELAPGQDLAAHVTAEIAAMPEDGLLILTAHIDANGRARFQDGSALPVGQLRGRGQVWVLGCDTVDHMAIDLEAKDGRLLATAGTPNVEHTLDAAHKLVLSFTKPRCATYETALRTAQNRGFAFLIPLTGLTLLLDFDDDDDDDDDAAPAASL